MSVLAELVALRRGADDPIRIDVGATTADPWHRVRPETIERASDPDRYLGEADGAEETEEATDV